MSKHGHPSLDGIFGLRREEKRGGYDETEVAKDEGAARQAPKSVRSAA